MSCSFCGAPRGEIHEPHCPFNVPKQQKPRQAFLMDAPGYERLGSVLLAAYSQAAHGKGKERHANDLPFHEQPMQQIARRRGLGFLLGQVDKKTEEAQGMLERGDREAWEREILGAIVYLAGALIFVQDSKKD